MGPQQNAWQLVYDKYLQGWKINGMNETYNNPWNAFIVRLLDTQIWFLWHNICGNHDSTEWKLRTVIAKGMKLMAPDGLINKTMP